MFDPKIVMDERLVAELSVNADKFYSKRDCDEQELKYLLTSNSRSPFQSIRAALQRRPNRIVDMRNWEQRESSLVTLNLDTVDQKLAKAGFSLRVRFAYAADGEIKHIDMCLKTAMPVGTNVLPFNKTRGEWEIELSDRRPDINRLIAEHANSRPRIPDAFIALGIQDKDLFVETIGATHRNVFPSYEQFERKGNIIVSVFQHTEDDNIFLNAHADTRTGSDREAEAEFLGLVGVDENDITPEQFNNKMHKAMELTDRIIRTSDTSLVTNDKSKAVRSRAFLESNSGPSIHLVDKFDHATRIMEASKFALSQRVRPDEQYLLDNLRPHIAPMRAEAARLPCPEENTFQYKLAR